MTLSSIIAIVIVEILSAFLVLDIKNLPLKKRYRFGLGLVVLIPVLGAVLYLMIRPSLGFKYNRSFNHYSGHGNYYFHQYSIMKMVLQHRKEKFEKDEKLNNDKRSQKNE